jgi:hypothetical protein
MERNEVIEIAINKFRGGSAGDMANWIDMALDLYGDRPKDVQDSPQVSGYIAYDNQAPQSVRRNCIPLINDQCRMGKVQNVPEGMSQQVTYGLQGSKPPLSGAAVLGAEDARPENEETVDDVHTRMIEGLPSTIAIEPEGCKKPMQCEVIVTKIESPTPGGRQPCVGVRFQWDTGDSKEVVCDNFIFPGKVQSPESVLSEMVDRVKSVYRRRASPIVAKTPALDKTPINAGNA